MKGWFKKLGFIVDNDVSTTQQTDSKDSQQTSQSVNQHEQPITQMLPFKDLSPQQQQQQLPTTNTTLSKQPATHDIVVVNSEYKKSPSSYYLNKYTPLINGLTQSKPILIQHDNMKITFDRDIISYLFTDISTIFNEKSSIIDQQQKHFLSSINQTHDLANIFHDIHFNPIHNTTNSFKRHETLMQEIDSLEMIINNLNETADTLLNDLNTLELKLHK